jgi:hypothetical protein
MFTISQTKKKKSRAMSKIEKGCGFAVDDVGVVAVRYWVTLGSSHWLTARGTDNRREGGGLSVSLCLAMKSKGREFPAITSHRQVLTNY